MSETLGKVRALVIEGRVRISDHGYDELAEDAIIGSDVVTGMEKAVVVEDYPAAAKGPSVLILQSDRDGRPVHALWGIPKGEDGPAVLITAYRPDPTRWSEDFTRRRR